MRRLPCLAPLLLLCACDGGGGSPVVDAGPLPDGAVVDGGVVDRDAARPDAGYEIPTPLSFLGWSPLVAVETDGQPVIDFILDTGSPVTVLDTDYYGGAPGPDTADLATFGTVYPAVDIVRFNAFGSPPPGAILIVGGILGSDFLAGRAVTIDYHDARGYLFDRLAGEPWVDAAVRTTVTVPFDLAGGGGLSVPGDGTVTIGPTRIVLTVTFEGTEAEVVVDTGATHTILEEDLLVAFGDPSRPMLRGVDVGRIGGVSVGYLSRAASMDIGGASVAGPPVLVLPGTTIFDSLRSETGRSIRALLGSTFLRHFLTTFDYRDSELLLARFTDDAHVDPREWIGPGIEVSDGPSGDFIVSDVYEGTDAEAAGVVPGMRIAEIDGAAVDVYDLDGFRRLLSSKTVGERIGIGFREGVSVVVTPVLVEDLLPAYP